MEKQGYDWAYLCDPTPILLNVVATYLHIAYNTGYNAGTKAEKSRHKKSN
jgi:hypothetical protein